MRSRMFQRRDQRGMLLLVPMPQVPSPEALEKHGPLEAVGAIDDEREAGIDWGSVKYELDIYGYATLPPQALSRSNAATPRRAQSP